MDKPSITRRISEIRTELKKNKLDCLIVVKPANVTYTTGFSGGESWAIITPGNVYLITDCRYSEQAISQCRGCKIIQRKSSMVRASARLLNKLKSVRVAAVASSISVGTFSALKKDIKGKVKATAGIVEQARNIKEAGEISAVRTACRIAAKALKQTGRYVKPGITESELAGRLDFQIRKLDSTNSFETIVAFGANASRPHHQPTGRRLKKNDTVLIDFGVRYKGYCCDLTRCFTLGRVGSLYKRAYQAVREAQAAALELVKPGVEVKDIDAAARGVIKEHNLPVYGHGTGHGLGLEVHEEPVISDKVKGRLQAGMVFTIEPGIYIPGKLGIRIEDDVLVTKTACKILSTDCTCRF